MPRKDNTRRKPRLRLVTPPKPGAKKTGTTEITFPDGVDDADTLFASTIEGDYYGHLGLCEGDVVVTYKTADVRAGELAAIEVRGLTYLGAYRPAPGGYFTFETEDDTERFKPGTALLLGRVCHFERRGEIFRAFRAIR